MEIQNFTNEFFQYAFCCLTENQQDLILVKYYIAKNPEKTLKELQEEIEKLKTNYKFIRSNDRIRKLKAEDVPVAIISYELHFESNIT